MVTMSAKLKSSKWSIRQPVFCGQKISPWLPRRPFQLILFFILVITIYMNITFILDANRMLKQANKDSAAYQQLKINDRHYRSLRSQSAEKQLDNGLDSNLILTDNYEDNYIDAVTRKTSNSRSSLHIEVLSSQSKVTVTIDGTVALENSSEGASISGSSAVQHSKGRGIHVLVISEVDGKVMTSRLFDTYSPHEDEAMSLFLSMVSPNRILIFCIKDEGTFQLKKTTRELLKKLGSEHSFSLNYRDMWAMITLNVKTDSPAASRAIKPYFAEAISRSPSFNNWGAPVLISKRIPLLINKENTCTNWPKNDPISQRRKEFCNRFEGYGQVCKCDDPAPIEFSPKQLLENKVADVPIVVIACDRPHYLFNMLRSLLSVSGVNKNMITIYVDGFFDEPVQVAKLFDLRVLHHTPIGTSNARISQHYKASLTATFNLFPQAEYAIVLEEDLDVSPDFFSYFSQTKHLLAEDPTIYCISAWSDQGYDPSGNNKPIGAYNNSIIYRVETMPGLGWMLSKKLYKLELEQAWPSVDKRWDWDMWLRLPSVRKNRECIIPEVSRTFHFGTKGLNMNTNFHDRYFKNHAFNRQSDVKLHDVDSVKEKNYELQIQKLLEKAIVLDHSKSPCDDDFIPNNIDSEPLDRSYVVFIKMSHSRDYATWLKMSSCFGLWDLDIRGVHKQMWRLSLNNRPLLVVGYPQSPYSIYKPPKLQPISLDDKAPKRINKV